METSPPSTDNIGGTGTAAAVSRNRYLLTNHHVVEDCNVLKIRQDGKCLNAKLISTDAVNDLALLKTAQSSIHLTQLRDDLCVGGGDG